MKKRSKVLFGVMLMSVGITILLSCKGSVERMSVLHNNPYFQLAVESYGARYGVTVNGVYVHKSNDSDVKADFLLPINQWFTSGTNTLALRVVPSSKGGEFDASAYVKITLSVKTAGNSDKNKSYVLMENVFVADESDMLAKSFKAKRMDSSKGFIDSDSGDVVLRALNIKQMDDYKGGLVVERVIDVPSSLPRWAFLDGEDLPDVHGLDDDDYYSMVDELLQQYKKVESAIEIGNIDSVLPMFAERNRELDLAFYEKPGTTEQELRSSLIEAAQDDELVIAEMESSMLNFSPTTNKKLLELVRGDGGAALGLNYKSGGSISFPIMFRRENGQWIITR